MQADKPSVIPHLLGWFLQAVGWGFSSDVIDFEHPPELYKKRHFDGIIMPFSRTSQSLCLNSLDLFMNR